MSSLAKPPSETAVSAASKPAGAPAPELALGVRAVVIDQAGLIVAAEPICAPLFYWQPAELVGQPLELLLRTGADKIRQQLVPDLSRPDSNGLAPPRLFALARRKDDSSFGVAVTLQRQAGSWWAVGFQDVHPPATAQPEIRAAAGLQPASTLRRRRAGATAPCGLESIPDVFQRVGVEPASQPEPPPTAPLGLESIPDVFQRVGAEPAPQPEPSATAPAVAPESPASAARLPLSQEQVAPAAPAAQPAPANSDVRLHELKQRLAQSAQAQPPQPPAPAPAPSADEPAPQDQLLELESRLRSAVSSLARTTAELETERGERRRSEQRAATLADRMQQLHEDLKAHLAAGQTDRQRFTELEQQLREQGQQNDLAVAKLQSALQQEQCERQRLEAELLRSRGDSARAGRVLVNRLRRQLQPPVQSLNQDACRVLQLQISDDQKQLVQAMLENILLVQTSLQECPES